MKLTKILRSCDLLASHVQLKLAGNEGATTALGGFMFICAIFAFLGAFGYVIFDYWRTDQPNVATAKYYGQIYPTINVTDGNQVPVLYFADSKGQYIDEKTLPKYLTVQVATLNLNFVEKGFIKEYTPYKLVNCSTYAKQNPNLQLISQDSGMLREVFERYGFCIEQPAGGISVTGRLADRTYASFKLNFMPCSLISGCVNASQLVGFNVMVAFNVPVLTFDDYEKPVQYTTSSDEYYFLTPGLTQWKEKTLKQESIYDTRGFLYPEFLRVNFSSQDHGNSRITERSLLQTTCTPVQGIISPEVCIPYLQISLISSGTSITYKRNYKSLMEALGDIGGLKEIIFFGIGFLYSFYNSREKKARLVSEVYGIKKSVKPKTCCKKKKQRIEHAKSISSATSISTRATIPDYEQVKKEWPKTADGQYLADPEIFDTAFKNIESMLDATSICKELNTLKFIMHFLLKGYHQKLIPLAVLNLNLKKSSQIEAINQDLKDPDINLESPQLRSVNFAVENLEDVLSPEDAYWQLRQVKGDQPDSPLKSPGKRDDSGGRPLHHLLKEEVDEKLATIFDDARFMPYGSAFVHPPVVELVQRPRYHKISLELASPTTKTKE